MIEEKPCQHCSKPMHKNDDPKYGSGSWGSRRYCSRACVGKARAAVVPDPERFCAHCKNRLARNPADSNRAWNARRFCSRRCATLYRYEPPSELIEDVEWLAASGCGVPEISKRVGVSARTIERLLNRFNGRRQDVPDFEGAS